MAAIQWRRNLELWDSTCFYMCCDSLPSPADPKTIIIQISHTLKGYIWIWVERTPMLSQQVFRRGDSPPLTREPGTQRLPETDSFFWKDLSQDSFVSTLKLCDTTCFQILKNIQSSFCCWLKECLLWRTLVAVSERHLEAAVCLSNRTRQTKQKFFWS